MKVTRITIVVLWALSILPLATSEAKAGVDGFAMYSPSARGQLPPYDPFRHRHHHHRAFGLWPGYYDVPQYAPAYDLPSPTPETDAVAPTSPKVERFYVVRKISVG